MNQEKIMIELKDYSDITETNIIKKYKNKNIATSDKYDFCNVRRNLGLVYDGGKYITSGFCGCCYLKDIYGDYILDDKGNKVILNISKSRFSEDSEDCILNMLNKIMTDDEFDQYFSNDLEEGKRLITYFFDEDLILAKSTIDEYKILTYISFVRLVLDFTRRGLMSKSVRKTQNFTGKIRGKIDIKNQITKNVMRGRDDRQYCKYSEKSVDIMENQVLKYALNIVIKGSKSLGLNNIERSIGILKRRFSGVSDVKLSVSEIDRIILPAMYQSYRPMFQLAKVIISEKTLYPTSDGDRVGVIPYAINMPFLFECYVRTILKEQIKNRNENNEKNKNYYYIEMKKFVSDKRRSYDESYGCRMSTKGNCYIKGNLVPDIVLEYYKIVKDQNDEIKTKESLGYRVYDVKYKWSDNKNNARDDRLQFLAYCFIYGVRGKITKKDTTSYYSGLIFPKQNGKKSNDAKINFKQDNQSDVALYHQLFIDINPENIDTNPENIDTNPKKDDLENDDTWKWLEW